MRVVVRAFLESRPGWRIVGEAADGLAALAFVGHTRPDVIVLDHQMPVLDGLGALPALRRNCPSARIVMWSSDAPVRELALAAGSDAFVDKSDPLQALLDALVAKPGATPADRRKADRSAPVAGTERLVLALPPHRMVAGATVAFTPADGVARRIVLPPDVQPGRVLPVPSSAGDATVLTLELALASG